MAQLSTIFGLMGNVTSFLIYLVPIRTFGRNRSVEGFDVVPYVMAVLNSSMWIYYGLAMPGRWLISPAEFCSVVLESAYVAIYLTFAPPVERARTVKMVCLLNHGFFGGALLLTQLAFHGQTRYDVIGFICICLCSFAYMAPLAIMGLVIKTKSVEFMPLLLSLFIFVGSFFWIAYAYLVGDVFIGLPNAAGLLFGLAQLILYGIYMNSKESKLARERSKVKWKEGRQHLIEQTCTQGIDNEIVTEV